MAFTYILWKQTEDGNIYVDQFNSYYDAMMFARKRHLGCKTYLSDDCSTEPFITCVDNNHVVAHYEVQRVMKEATAA